MKRSQSALETVFIYGFTIAVISLSLILLYEFGFFSPSNYTQNTVNGFTGFAVTQTCIPGGALLLNVENTQNVPVEITYINASSPGQVGAALPYSSILQSGESEEFFVLNACPTAANQQYSGAAIITYVTASQITPGPFFSNGSYFGKSASSYSQPLVANYTNSSYIMIHNSTTMYGLWHGRASNYGYTLLYWTNTLHAYSPCGSPSNACGAGIMTYQGCVGGLYKSSKNSTHFEFFGYEWNGTAGCGGVNRGAEAGPTMYAPYNKWQLVVVTFNFTSSGSATETTCLDGTCASSAYTLGGTPDTYSDGSTYITGTYQLNGKVADVQLYSTALSQSQIQDLYSEGYSGAPVTTNHLVAWLPLAGNANDYSGNNNNGAISSINWVSP